MVRTNNIALQTEPSDADLSTNNDSGNSFKGVFLLLKQQETTMALQRILNDALHGQKLLVYLAADDRKTPIRMVNVVATAFNRRGHTENDCQMGKTSR
jgi:hypothetical protein